MSEPTTAETHQTILATLAEDYAMGEAEVTRLPIGQGTVNYRAAWRGRDYFVKHYPAGTDLDAESQAIDLTDLAARHEVPTPGLVRTRQGQAISHRDNVAVSVWEWVRGHTVTDGFTPAQQEAAGAALGRIHHAFATHPDSARTSPELETWLHPDVTGIEDTITDLLERVAQRDHRDDFDHLAEQTLTERRHALREVPALLDGLPVMTTQVLHGDYSAVNLLFDGERLSAVTDFRPPEPFLIAYELGRIAFDPRTVVLDENWITAASRLVAAYLDTNPAVRGEDVRACARVALLQLLRSLYGVKQHYRKPGLYQKDLDDFWLLRHRASNRLLAQLDHAEAALDEITRR
ncbi:homoserine kinase type II [Haloactinospora alba]|uniref:Homoserine kinase type II n=1 Tax=Haloactinospora alba TaxID=405555 RepID=A0A543N9B5_9ACTN|nr:phosphotransferase [Haloactinospora alba]TQN28424.1 homoserine kinase type II [Haloactinospora alba]